MTMEKNIILKNDIWIWHISSQNSGYRPARIESDVIYEQTNKTVSILSHNTHKYDQYKFNISKEELICYLAHNISHDTSKFINDQGQYMRCNLCGSKVVSHICISTNESLLYGCSRCVSSIDAIRLVSKCENYIYNNNTSIKLGKRVDTIIHTLSGELQFLCRHTIDKDDFYSIISEKEILAPEGRCKICNMTRINDVHSLDYPWNYLSDYFCDYSCNSSCDKCRNISYIMCFKEWVDKCILIKRFCMDIVLPFDIIEIIINFSIPQYLC